MENNEKKAEQGQAQQGEKKKLSFRELFGVGEVFGYFFRRKDAARPTNINIRMMHGVNKISIIIFLAGVIYLIFKLVIKPRL